MVLKFWQSVVGLLVEESPFVKATATCSPRYADAVIFLGQETRRVFGVDRANVTLAGKDVIVVQAKASRLGIQRGVDWQMKIDDARCKLASVYPKIKL